MGEVKYNEPNRDRKGEDDESRRREVANQLLVLAVAVEVVAVGEYAGDAHCQTHNGQSPGQGHLTSALLCTATSSTARGRHLMQ